MKWNEQDSVVKWIKKFDENFEENENKSSKKTSITSVY